MIPGFEIGDIVILDLEKTIVDGLDGFIMTRPVFEVRQISRMGHALFTNDCSLRFVGSDIWFPSYNFKHATPIQIAKARIEYEDG